MEIVLISAYSLPKRVIGFREQIPWSSDEEIRKPDMKRFRIIPYQDINKTHSIIAKEVQAYLDKKYS